jgi:outer membrane protein assembly factor BamB
LNIILILLGEKMKKIYTIIIIFFLICLIFPLTTSNSNDNNGLMDSAWPMKCHDEKHTGRSPYSPNNGLTPLIKWEYWMEGMMQSCPVIDNDGIIYIGTSPDEYPYLNETIHAIYSNNGTQKWGYFIDQWMLTSPALCADGTIYAGSFLGRGDFVALNPDGTEKWVFHSDTVGGDPVITEDGTIYFGVSIYSTTGKLYALNPNGTEKWSFDTYGPVHSAPAIDEDDNIYFGDHHGYFYSLYPNGTQRWRIFISDPIQVPPLIDEEGVIYYGSWDNNLYAIYNNGTEKWRFNTGSSIDSGACLGPDGTIYAVSNNGYIFSINPDGTENWRFKANNYFPFSPITDANGIIYAGSYDGNLYAINPEDGSERWRFTQDDVPSVSTTPIIDENGVIYIVLTYWQANPTYSIMYALELIENNPPSPPSIDGESNGNIDTTYPYTFLSTDPDNDTISYMIDWGDNSDILQYGPRKSGESITVEHTWTDAGAYIIKAKAVDEHGSESNWSTHNVVMPKPKLMELLLDRFSERFPVLYRLFNFIN